MINKMQTGLSLFIVLLLITVPSHNLLGQDSARGKMASVNGMEMYYEIHGQGEPLVLLHGFLESSQGWTPFIEDFSQHFQLIIPDLRGHGRSTNPNPTEIFSIRKSAEDVLALLDHLEITKFKAIGASLGSVTLLHLLTLQPDRVDSTILIGGTSHFPENLRKMQRNMLVESLPEQAWENYRKIHKNGDDQIRLLLSQFTKFADSYDDVNFTPEILSTITAKVLIVHGDRDGFFPVSIPAEMHKSIPKSYLYVVPNGGHIPILGKNKSNFTQTALEFLRGMWEKNARIGIHSLYKTEIGYMFEASKVLT